MNSEAQKSNLELMENFKKLDGGMSRDVGAGG